MRSSRFLLLLAAVSLLVASATISWLNFDVMASFAGAADDRIITTVVGGGYTSSAPAREAPISLPLAIARDTQGRGFFFIDDLQGDRLLRFLNTTQNTVTLAGTTIPGGQIGLIAGGGNLDPVDGANPREVFLGGMNGLVVDPTGNFIIFGLQILNSGNVMAVNLSNQTLPYGNHPPILPGKLAAILFATLPEMRGLVLGPNDRFYTISSCCGTPGGKVVRIIGNGDVEVVAGGGNPLEGNGDGGPANQARINNPTGIAFDSQGNLLITEGGGSRNSGAVRKVTTDGFISSLVTDIGFLSGYPVAIVIGPNDRVYVALGNGQRIVQIEGSSANPIGGDGSGFQCVITSNPTCGDGGPALSAAFNLPGSATELSYQTIQLAADANGVYIPDGQRGQDSGYAHIRYINRGANPVTIAGTTIAPNAINAVAGGGRLEPYDGAQAPYATLHSPHGVAVDDNDNLFIMDTLNHRLRFVNRSANPVTIFPGTPSSQTIAAGAIATLNRDVGEPIGDDRILTAFFDSLQGIAINANGVFLADAQNGIPFPGGQIPARKSGLIRFLNTSASTVTFYPGSPSPIQVPPGQVKVLAGLRPGQGVNPVDIGDGGLATAAVVFTGDVAVDAAGNIYVADYQASRVRRIDANTGIINTLLEGLNRPTGVAFDGAGRLLVANTYNNQILRQNSPGSTQFAVIGDGTLNPPISRPRDMVVDGSGRIYVVNSGSNRILELNAPNQSLGTTSAFAGSGAPGLGGDGGPAVDAQLNLVNPNSGEVNQPNIGIALLKNDVGVVFSDVDNNRIRQVGHGPRALRVMGPTITAGGSGVASVILDSLGDENGVAFSLNFDATRLTFVSASIAGGLPQGSTLVLDTTEDAIGRVGVILSLPFGQALNLGAHPLVTFTFNASVSSPLGSTPIGFGDLPVPRELLRVDASSIPLNSTTFNSGSVTIIAPVEARNVRAIGAPIRVGTSGSVLVEIDAMGNENALGFSLAFDASRLAFVTAAVGSGVPGASLIVNTSQVADGRVGVAIGLSQNQAFQAGTRQVVVLTFTAPLGSPIGSTQVVFTDAPVVRELVSTQPTMLPVIFTDATIAIQQAFEGDVSPRPDGNGMVTLADWVQMGRIAGGLDTVSSSSEFQRADCAPRETLGNGSLTLVDWVQAGRYAIGLDPPTSSGGPTSASLTLPAIHEDSHREHTNNLRNARQNGSARSGTVISVSSRTTRPDAQIVVVWLNVAGDENAISFSVSFDFEEWELFDARPGFDHPTGSLIINRSMLDEGRVGFAFALPPGQTLSMGWRRLVEVKLRPRSRLVRSPSPVAFIDQPLRREIVNVTAEVKAGRWEAPPRPR